MAHDDHSWIKNPITIGLTGGSGAGKSTLSRNLITHLGEDQVTYLPHDAYYLDLGHLSREERLRVNFDHPDSLDTGLYIDHIERLQRGEPVDKPVYDFVAYTRTTKTERVTPRRVIVVEGILIFSHPHLRDLMDLRVFIDVSPDVRFIRRLLRDTEERGRTTASVITRWIETVRPMHLEFVEPNKRFADIIIPEQVNHIASELMIGYLEKYLDKPDARPPRRPLTALEIAVPPNSQMS